MTKTGGRLVKNVTGFELHRLYAGSGGGLCLILEATLRLFTAPAARAHASFTCDSLESALALSELIAAPPVEPTAVTLSRSESGWSLNASFDGRSERVDRERALMNERAPGARWSEGPEALAAHIAARDSSPEEGGEPSLRVSARPSRLLPVIEALQAHDPSSYLLAHPCVGALEVRLSRAAGLDSLVSELRRQGATVRVRGALDESARPPATDALEERLRDAIDPHHLFCGRP